MKARQIAQWERVYFKLIQNAPDWPSTKRWMQIYHEKLQRWLIRERIRARRGYVQHPSPVINHGKES